MLPKNNNNINLNNINYKRGKKQLIEKRDKHDKINNKIKLQNNKYNKSYKNERQQG